MNIEICKYKNGAPCAFSFTFDDGCYYDSTCEVIEKFEDVYQKTGVKIKAKIIKPAWKVSVQDTAKNPPINT